MRHIVGAIALIVILASNLAAAPKSTTVGDPKNPAGLAGAVADAYNNGARKIVIAPGVYVLPSTGHSALELHGWKNAIVSAAGVTLIITDLTWEHNVFDLRDCTNVTVSGPILSQNKVTAYQGRVIAVGTDADGKATCDFRPDPGYPVPPAAPKGAKGGFLGGDVNIVNKATRKLKLGCGDFYGVPGEDLGNGTFRVTFNQKTLPFGVGDWLVGRYGDAPFKVYLNNCRGCTVRDVTLMRNGFAPLREDGGGGNHYLHCRWALGPRPGKATEAPLVTNAADGMHMIGSFPGPDIEDCVFEGVFLDDCIAIHGGFTAINAVSGPTLTLEKDGGLVVGQPARISNEKGFFGEATVTALRDNGDKTWTVTLDRDLGVPADAKVSNPRRNGAGYKIIGCRLGGTRSRGILIKADNGVIQNNVVDGCGQAAISLGPEYYWNEADYVRNTLISGNTFRANGSAAYGGAAILIHGDGAIGNANLTLRDNRFVSNYQGDVEAAWIDGLVIANNTLTGAAVWPPFLDKHSPIALSHCRNVAVWGNVVKNPVSYKPEVVSVGEDVSVLIGDESKEVLISTRPKYRHPEVKKEP